MPAITRKFVTLSSRGRSPKPSLGPRPLASLRRLAVLARQRRRLGDLPDHLLKDVGIMPDDARLESRRPVWDVPARWQW